MDALIEGMVMHKILSTAPLPKEQIRSIVARTVLEPDTHIH
jgi:DNA-binding transcriptional regulator YbjK